MVAEKPAGSLAGEHGSDYLVKPDGSLELTGTGSLGIETAAQGRYISPGGEHVIFSTGHAPAQSRWCSEKQGEEFCKVTQLEPDAAPTGTGTVYDRGADGPTHVVSLLPGDAPQIAGQQAFYQGTSKNASSIAFKIEGTLYVRVNSGDEASEETEEAAAGNPVYAGFSEDGSYLFYVTGGENGVIHRFEIGSETDTPINPGSEGEVVNISANGSHVYFVSREVLTGSQQNSQGEAAVPPSKGTGTLAAANGTGKLTSGSPTVSNLTTSKGSFEAGMQISGSGIPEGTTIEGVGPGTLTLSKAATESGSRTFAAGSTQVTGVTVSEGDFVPGREIKGPGIPAGTEIVAVAPGALTLSQPATEAGTKELTVTAPNLYVWSGGEPQFIATVAASDPVQTSGSTGGFCEGEIACGVPALTRWTSYAVAPTTGVERGPGADSSRTTPDGEVIAFESRAKLTGYENAGHTEVYRWEEGGAGVECISCNLGSPPTTDARLQDLQLVNAPMVIHNLSDDGSRVFFETSEALSTADIDGVNDIYEWQSGEGTGNTDLISSGTSLEYELLSPNVPNPFLPAPNRLIAATPDGSDVVFFSQDDLTGQAGAGGVPAIYDARVGGGFPPPTLSASCSEEGCRGVAAASGLPAASPQSESAAGSGNVKPRKRHCRHHRGKKKGSAAARCAGGHSKHRKAQTRRRSQASSSASSVDQERRPLDGSPATSTPGTPAAPSSKATEPSAPVSAAASDEFSEFGIKSLAAGLSTTAAGQHPDFTTTIAFNSHFTPAHVPTVDAHLGSLEVSLPPGLLGNPNAAVPKCTTGQLIAFGHCPEESQVGITRAVVSEQGQVFEPLYNLVPPHPDREIARLGFFSVIAPVFIDIKVRTASDYGATAIVHSPPGLKSVVEAETTIWGDPSDPSHDPQRLTAPEGPFCPSGTACEQPEGKREVPRTGLAFMTNPAGCQQGKIGLAATSYQIPDQVFSTSTPLPDITDCQGLPFAPSFEAQPTSHKAGATTGLTTKLILPQHLGASEPATATMREARVTLPQGMGVNPGAANWIDTCSEAQVGFHLEVDANCPNGSKLGTARFVSPALPEPFEGAIYQRAPEPGHQLGLWLVADALGLHVKLPGTLQPDNKTGRLTAVFTDIPQVPVEEIDLNVWGGPRAPLTNPSSCGTYQTSFTFTPYSNDPAASGSAPMQINEGCSAPFDPKLNAGTTNPVAGKYSSLIVDLERPDADQALRGFELTLPDGLLAKIKGVGRCTDAQASAGACPADSRLGSVTAIAGPGSDPLLVPQTGKASPSVYLGGPYEGSPLSVITLVPAQAGPFDLGTLVVQSGLGLDPDTNRGVVKADPLPQFFEGVQLTYRRLHVKVDRPGFTLNPTDCRAMQVDSTVTSTQGTVAHPAARFKVNGCKRLKFKPKLSLSLKGGTERSDYPALTATLKARKGDAGIGRIQVGLPHSEFLAQEHIITICTRKQFAVDKCPKGSVYGAAKVWTPLLAKPLSGPVYLRSSDNPLPDMVLALHGELDANLVGRIDSHNGGIRATFSSVPDAPFTKAVLRMKGGAKGLLVNSTDVCRHIGRAQANFTAQNGREAALRPRLLFKGCGGKRKNG